MARLRSARLLLVRIRMREFLDGAHDVRDAIDAFERPLDGLRDFLVQEIDIGQSLCFAQALARDEQRSRSGGSVLISRR